MHTSLCSYFDFKYFVYGVCSTARIPKGRFPVEARSFDNNKALTTMLQYKTYPLNVPYRAQLNRSQQENSWPNIDP